MRAPCTCIATSAGSTGAASRPASSMSRSTIDATGSTTRSCGMARSTALGPVSRIAFTGSKEDVREYLHVRDAARLSVEILSEGFRNQHIIITGHHPMKAVDLLSMIREILHRDVTITFTNTQ